jgi:serine/threonine protein kinase
MKPLAPNSLIQNRYLVVHLIGKGGMGEVYLAVDQRLGSAVALKRTFFADDEMLGNAFEREARILARLRHPVLPKVSDHFMENGEQYLVMEHIAGDDLSKRLESAQKPFPLSWVLFWADQLLDALAYLHSHEPPIIHRDIKPQNLKLTDENHIVLLDFGLSKNTTGQTRTSSGSTGSVVGYTPHYAPMEQIRGTGTNPRSDLYSLSATLYQLMSNTVPADALTRADALLNGSPDPIKPLNEVNAEVSSDVSTVILHGMEVSQEKRFPDAKSMQKALRKAYSEMQEAMSAQTIMFQAPGEHSSKIEQPVGLEHTPEPGIEANDSEATRIKSEPSSVPVAATPNFEETIRYDGPIDSVPQRQADIKTEVYDGATSPFRADIPTPPVEPVVPEPVAPAADEWAVAPSTGNGGYVPDPTVANIAFDATTPGSPYTATGSYSAPSEAVAEDPYATRIPTSTHSQQFVAQTPQVQAAPKKGSSKALIIVGVLVVLAVVGIGMAVGGWFVYNNYYAAAQPTPTPSPEPSLEVTPTPAPTEEAITNTESNTNTSTAQANSNTNTNVFVEPTPEPTTEARDETPNPRNTPQIEARKTPGKTAQPNGKPTPKSNTPNRTVILQ